MTFKFPKLLELSLSRSSLTQETTSLRIYNLWEVATSPNSEYSILVHNNSNLAENTIENIEGLKGANLPSLETLVLGKMAFMKIATKSRIFEDLSA